MNTVRKLIKITILSLGIVGCGGGSSSSENNKEESLIIPIDGNTVEKFTFENENVLFTRGCVTANLYDSSNLELARDSDTEIGMATEGNYTYIANKYSSSENTVYAVVYAISMNIVPKTLENGVTYNYPAGSKDIKKITISETKKFIATANGSAHIKVYDSSLTLVDELYINQEINLDAGTYYLLLINGSCRYSKEITVNIL